MPHDGPAPARFPTPGGPPPQSDCPRGRIFASIATFFTAKAVDATRRDHHFLRT